MSEISNLVIEAAAAAGLDDDIALIGALGQLAANWTRMAQELDGFDSALALLRSIAAGAESEAVGEAFAKVGAEKSLEALRKHASQLAALLDEIPEEVQRLLRPIGDFDERRFAADSGRIAWPIINKTVAAGGTGGKPDFTLSLGASATVSLEAGDRWPYSDPMPEALLRFRAEGSLKPTGKASIPFSLGQVSVSGEASAACALEYYFAVAEQSTIYAAAAAQRLARLPDPFDFDAVWTAFETTDLAGIHYELDGSAEIKVEVAIADTAALGQWADVQLGATLSVGFPLGGKFFLTFRAAPRAAGAQPRIIASLSREDTRGLSLGGELGVSVDLARLAKKVHEVLERALGHWDGVLDDVRELLSPGTWLQGQADKLIQKKAKSLITNTALRDALVRDLQGVLGVGAIEDSAVAEWLSTQLAGTLDSATDWARDKTSAAVAVVDRLGRSLPAFAQPAFRAELDSAAADLVGAVDKALEDRVNALFNAQSAKLGRALRDLGAISSARLAGADAALSGVRALLDKYDALFRQIVAETDKAARARISATVTIEESRLTTATGEIEGTFLARSDAARKTFADLTRGNLDALVTLIATDGEGADFAVEPGKSRLGRYAAGKSKFGIELIVFGFGATGSALLSSEAGVLVDGSGNVQVDARAKLEKRFKGLDAERQIDLVNSYSLVRARALANAPESIDRALGLAVSMGHVDANLERRELERFVGSLVDTAILLPESRVLASQTLTRWIGNPGSNGRVAANLLLKLSLDRECLVRLLGLDHEAGSATLPDAYGRSVVLAALANLRSAGAFDGALFDASLAKVQRRNPGLSPDDLVMDERRIRRALETPVPGSHRRDFAAEDQPFADATSLAFGFREMLARFRQIYFSTPETTEDRDDSTWGPGDYRKAEEKATHAVRRWLQLNESLFWTNSKVHPRTIAFIETLADLAQVDRATALSLTLTRTDPAARPETVVLT